MLTSDFDYELPAELIAQFPTQKRADSKMLVLNKGSKTLEHKHFYDITDYLGENDILVLNNTKVLPARLYGEKETGAKIEVFLLKDLKNGSWQALIKPSKRVHTGDIIKISDDLSITPTTRQEEGKWIINLNCEGDIYEAIHKVGNIPLPPYIERKMTSESNNENSYQLFGRLCCGSDSGVTFYG